MERSGLIFENFCSYRMSNWRSEFVVLLFLKILNFFTLLKRLFAPTSQNPMTKLFRLSEKLWKKVVSDLKTFAHKGYQMAAQKKYIFLVSVILSALVERFFVSRTRYFFVVVVCYHSLKLGLSGWTSLALGVGNQANEWWWMMDDKLKKGRN